MERLATGRKINRGADDPAGLIAAMDLEAAISALEAESRSLERINSHASITDGHTAQLANLATDMQGLAVAAANAGALSAGERDAYQLEIDAMAESVQRFTNEAIDSLDGISLDGDGNSELAEQLRNAARGIATLASGGTNSLASGNFEEIQTIVGDAASAFAQARGTIGAYQKYDVQSRLNSIAAERESLTAAHSQLVDTDYAEETSNLARSRVLVEANISVLKIANHNQRTVLQLLS